MLFILLLLAVQQIDGFSKPNCEYAGLSCYDCYSRKQCINFFGLTHWTTEICGSGLTGEANIYCDPSTDKCTSTPFDGCASISRFNCLREGLLPHTKDCGLFHKCSVDLKSEDFLCAQNYVYKQTYGKCILKLSDEDCVVLPTCGLQDSISLYPGDSSIYYSCISSKFSIKACKESEIFDLDKQICKTRCTTNGFLPNTRNCLKYYECFTSTESGNLEIKELTCPDGQGFNPSTKTCQINYKNICNELYLLETDIYDLISFTPITEIIISPIKNILNHFNINPMNVLFLLNLNDEILSDGILVIDYIYKNKKLPPATLTLLVDAILPRLPSSLQSIIKAMINLGIINLQNRSTTLNLTGNDEQEVIKSYLLGILSNTTIDVPTIINSFEGKSQQEISKMIFDEIMKVFQVPEYQIPFAAGLLKMNLPFFAVSINSKLGSDLVLAKDGTLRIDLNNLNLLFYDKLNDVAVRMYPDNVFLSAMFKMFARYQYKMNYGLITEVVHNFYFTANALV
ncbi:uncharacterized protein [Onthophagus taurus]|uniref:uncharacterized protein n=1 Tax=Onthophagus taurus TaxID=166361 RepID=UPI0039BDF5A3